METAIAERAARSLWEAHGRGESFANLTDALPQVEAGTIRAIVQTGKERNQFIAQVPTVAESGFPGFEAYAWWGIFAPAGTPKNIIERFGNEMAATLREERT